MAVSTQRPPSQIQQRNKSASAMPTLLTVSGIVLVTLLIIGAIGLAHTYGALPPSGTPKATDMTVSDAVLAGAVTQVFCTDLILQHYAEAYQLLSNAAQARYGSAARFSASANALDASNGIVRVCQTTDQQPLATVSGDHQSASLPLDVRRNKQPGPATGLLKLVYEGNTWKVNDADPSMNLLP